MSLADVVSDAARGFAARALAVTNAGRAALEALWRSIFHLPPHKAIKQRTRDAGIST
jgi:hypothetical protein